MTIKNFVKNLLEPPKYQLNSKILNSLNYQKIRCLRENNKYEKLKKSFNHESLNIKKNEKDFIDRNGYIILENFFDEKSFKIIVNSFNKYSNSNRVKYKKDFYNMIWGSGLISKNSDHPDEAKKIINLFESSRVLDFAKYLLKRQDLSKNFELSYQDLMLMDGKIDNIDPNRFIHADKHYHCVKSYFSIEDNHINNAPYLYVPKSHLMDSARIEFENELSKRSKTDMQFRVSDNDLKKFNFSVKSMIIKKNSLVISDNLGFHARGEMKKGFSRKQIRISFHSVQANRLQQFLRKTARRMVL